MSSIQLDLTPLDNAIARLDEGWTRYQRDVSDIQIRDGLQDMIRTGNERGLLLGAWPAWRKYREMRSRTSHTYDEEVAIEVVKGIPAFQREAAHLLQRLRAGIE